MSPVHASSPRAVEARELVVSLQQRFVARLSQAIDGASFGPVSWLRDGGIHGGGTRWVGASGGPLNRASVNVSQIHYDDLPDKRLSSATALSAIIHPHNPHAPSIHVHLSWTEMRDGVGYWRVMADLNPSMPDAAQTRVFDEALATAAPEQLAEGQSDGDRYFFIPALKRHRGVSHFYLEGYNSGRWDRDLGFVRRFGEAIIDVYGNIVRGAIAAHNAPSAEDFAAQLDYHTVYLLQVLTLDRGTTSGLLVHNQNDVGILGSLPAQVDRELLASWRDRMVAPQDALLGAIVDALPEEHSCTVSDEVRAELAGVVRAHYRAHPEALSIQASGSTSPPTVANHK